MKPYRRDAFRYTPLFCEENIWWLAHDLAADGIDTERLKVLFFSNPWQSIVVCNQRHAEPGRAVAWDYHVVLQAELEDGPWIFDLDTRLPFPARRADYLTGTFPVQTALPERYRTQVRLVPAAGYLAHFYSDRSHMAGRIPDRAFPDYPIIQPAPGVRPIVLADYRDMRKALPDGSEVVPVDALRHPDDTPSPAPR